MKPASLRLAVLAFAAACSLALAGPAEARPDWHGDCPGPKAPLTQEQRDAVHKLTQDFMDKTLGVRQALIVRKAELKAQLISPTPDVAKVENLSREIGELRGKMLSARLAYRAELARLGLPMKGCPMTGEGWGHRGPEAGFHGDDCPGADCDRGPRPHFDKPGHRAPHGECGR